MKSQMFPRKEMAGLLFFLLVFAFYLANLFRIGGETFIYNLNQTVNPIIAAATTIYLALLLPRLSATGSQNRRLWSVFVAGLVLWTIAELIWAVASVLGQEVPYPSWADAFWLAGYLPLYYALLTRRRSLPSRSTLLQDLAVWAIIVISISLTLYFVFIPIFQQNDPSARLESALNIIYPLMDLILLIIVLRILFAYQKGQYGRVWLLVSAGISAISVSDLIFAYASTAGIYYPEGQMNLISNMGVDVPYTTGYLLMLMGFYQLGRLLTVHRPVSDAPVDLPLIPNTHALVFSKGEDIIIDVSHNFPRVFPVETVKGASLSQVLGISPEQAETFLSELRSSGLLREKLITMNTRWGLEQVWISGIVVYDSQKQFSGVTLLLRLTADDDSLDDLLTASDQGIVRSLMSKTGTGQKRDSEIKDQLSRYYGAHIMALYNRLLTEGGAIMGDAFMTELQLEISDNGQIHFDKLSATDITALSPSDARVHFSNLLQRANEFVTRVIDGSIPVSITNDIDQRFGEKALKNMQRESQRLDQNHRSV